MPKIAFEDKKTAGVFYGDDLMGTYEKMEKKKKK
jgi:hypothetical protein